MKASFCYSREIYKGIIRNLVMKKDVLYRNIAAHACTLYILTNLLVLVANIRKYTQNQVLNSFSALHLCRNNSLYFLIYIYFSNITK